MALASLGASCPLPQSLAHGTGSYKAVMLCHPELFRVYSVGRDECVEAVGGNNMRGSRGAWDRGEREASGRHGGSGRQSGGRGGRDTRTARTVSLAHDDGGGGRGRPPARRVVQLHDVFTVRR